VKKLIAVIILIISITILPSKSALALDKPVVSFLGISQSPLIQGDKEKFYITSKGAKEVQYRVFLYEEKTKLWTEVTSGYTATMNAQVPYELSPQKVFNLGKYKLSIWVREKGSSEKNDSFYIANLNCVSRDDNNRVYLNGDLQVDKDEYMVGDNIKINGVANISGMKGPYKYMLNIYNVTKDQWSTHITNYSENVIQWKPTEVGTYVLDVWAMSANSSLWSKITKDPHVSVYEGWKLKVINVIKSNTSLTNYNYSLDNMANTQYALNNSLTDVTGKWIAADKLQIMYYIDPLNFPSGEGKYQFLKLNYNQGISVSEINSVLKGKGVLSDTGQSFLDASIKNNVNPAYLMAHSFLETGNGTSTLSTGYIVTRVDGKNVAPKATFNLFGIGAIDSDPIRLGSEYAYKNGWFSVKQAVVGGSGWISKYYINNSSNAQNTLYKMRWNPSSTGYHQYATDIAWANKQTKIIKQIMDKFINTNLYFDVPKYLS